MSIALETLRPFDPRFPLSRRELEGICGQILEFLGFSEAHLDLRIVDDREMARLNRTFLGLTGPTNVLSFPAESDESPEGSAEEPAEGMDGDAADFLGSVALSAETLAREADLYGQPPKAHLVRLLAHAVLHLAGLDHGPEMFDLTDAAVESLTEE